MNIPQYNACKRFGRASGALNTAISKIVPIVPGITPNKQNQPDLFKSCNLLTSTAIPIYVNKMCKHK